MKETLTGALHDSQVSFGQERHRRTGFRGRNIASVAASPGPAVYVADVEQLYAAVNNPMNVGASVVLAPGNHAIIELHGVSKQIDVVAVASSPEDPSGSNTVTVVR